MMFVITCVFVGASQHNVALNDAYDPGDAVAFDRPMKWRVKNTMLSLLFHEWAIGMPIDEFTQYVIGTIRTELPLAVIDKETVHTFIQKCVSGFEYPIEVDAYLRANPLATLEEVMQYYPGMTDILKIKSWKKFSQYGMIRRGSVVSFSIEALRELWRNMYTGVVCPANQTLLLALYKVLLQIGVKYMYGEQTMEVFDNDCSRTGSL